MKVLSRENRSALYLKFHRRADHAMKVRLERWLRRLLRLRHIITVSPYGVKFAAEYGDYVQLQLIRHQQYEPASLALFRTLLKNGDIVLDVGAHVGQYGLHAAALVGGQGTVIAMEPNQKAHALLRRNIGLNTFTNMFAVHGAIAQHVGVIAISTGDDTNWGAAHRQSSMQEENPQLVLCAPISDVVSAFGLERIDILKADVEGMEGEVLASLFQSPRIQRPRHILIEFISESLNSQGSSSEAVTEMLAREGYTLRDINGRQYLPGGPLPENNLWASLVD